MINNFDQLGGYQRLLTILSGKIPDRLPLLHVWGHREGYHAGHLSAWANERRLPVRAQTTFLKYQQAHGHALGIGVEGWFSKLPKGEGEAAGGVHRYLQHGIEIGYDLRPFEELGDMDALAEETIRMKTLNQAHGLGTRGCVELLKDAGVAVMYHTDGKVDAVLPMLIEMGVDCFHGCEKAANDLADINTSVPNEAPLENYAAFVETIRSEGNYP